MELTHEKYVSIEYDTWINKYKPMEDAFSTLKKEYYELSKSKKIRIFINWTALDHKFEREIGAVDLFFDDSALKEHSLSIPDRAAFRKAIHDVVKSDWYSYSAKKELILIEDLKSQMDTLEKKREELKKIHYERIAEDKVINEKREALKKEMAAIVLPRFFNWLIKLFSKK